MNSIKTIRNNLSARIRFVRTDRYGDDELGMEAIAEAIGIPADTWSNYEDGITVPAEVLLKLIEMTRVNPHWLLTGKGERYSRTDPRLRFMPMN